MLRRWILFSLSLFSLSLPFAVSATSTWLNGWSYRKQITISHANVDSNLSDFPLLVKISADTDLGSYATSSGSDIRFTTGTGMLLSYERESYHVRAGSGSGVFWVKVPTISHSMNTDFFLYYGNASARADYTATGSPTVAQSVWNNNFNTVFHFNENIGASTAYDATSHHNNGAVSGTTFGNPGLAGPSAFFGGNSNPSTIGGFCYGWDYDNGCTGNLTHYTDIVPLTVEVWVKPETLSMPAWETGIFTNRWYIPSFTLEQLPTPAYGIWYYDDKYTSHGFTGVKPVSLGAWDHLALVFYPNVKVQLYVNGVIDTEVPLNADSMTGGGTIAGLLGRSHQNFNNRYFYGYMDEARFSVASRSAEWIKFEYNNMNTSTNELSFSAQDIPTTTTTVASSLLSSTYGQALTFTAHVSSSIATGTVTFKDGTTTIGTGSLSAGTATFTLSALAVGTHSISAAYGGDIDHSGSTSDTLTQMVSKATTNLSLASSPNPVLTTATCTLTASIVPSGATGTVTFSEGSTILGTGILSSGITTLTIGPLSLGTHFFSANYAETDSYLASATGISQSVTDPPPPVGGGSSARRESSTLAPANSRFAAPAEASPATTPVTTPSVSTETKPLTLSERAKLRAEERKQRAGELLRRAAERRASRAAKRR